MIVKSPIILGKKMCLIVFFLLLGFPFFAQDSQEPLKYEVSVNVMPIPCFVVDKNGDPVVDLHEDEFQLYVNDKPVNILAFRRYEFNHDREMKEEVDVGETGIMSQPAQDRVLFLILDTMFNSLTGFRRGKQIAINLIKEGLPGDRFVVLENNPIGGLKYLGGWESDNKELIKRINRLRTTPEKWNNHLSSDLVMPNRVDYDPEADPRYESGNWKTHRELISTSEKYRYQHQVKHFSQVLSQFKYALKTIDKPKIVFLISEGIASGAFRSAMVHEHLEDRTFLTQSVYWGSCGGCCRRQLTMRGKKFLHMLDKADETIFNQNKLYSAFMFSYLLDVVRSINYGGSVLYTINPKRGDDINENDASGEMSLRLLASESGGKYFAGSRPKRIVEQIKKTTAAYYELFFKVLPDMGSDMMISLDCKRKDVMLHSLIHSERNRPYPEMEPLQKKLFALDVATGGSWSRIVGKVMKARYKKITSRKGENEKVVTLNVPLPTVMQNRKTDMFLIRMDPKTQKTQIDRVRRDVNNMAVLKFKRRNTKNQFFVIIEPTTPYCIYNKI